mmetsp:Transcript_14746/g.41092  ORF Transcript_14746/g.41092 Transcript_14746/m.41092 type:complete len:85 (+) Transcript_14746:4102-4356(+)
MHVQSVKIREFLRFSFLDSGGVFTNDRMEIETAEIIFFLSEAVAVSIDWQWKNCAQMLRSIVSLHQRLKIRVQDLMRDFAKDNR